MIHKKLILLPFLILFMLTSVYPQVAISPTSAFLDSKKRFETILIRNNSDDPQEVKLEFKFAYPKASEAGNIELIYDDRVEDEAHSCADWLRGFPKTFVLGPGERQIVRVTAKPPRNISSGVYWSRLITTSNAVSPEVGTPSEGAITAQIALQFNQVTSIFYSTGDLSTDINLKNIRPIIEDNKANIFVDYSKSGNAPFLGTFLAQIYDTKNKLVLERKLFVSIYYDGLRKVNLDIGDLPKGEYAVTVTVTSGRKDIPDANIVPTDPQTIRGSFTKL